MTTPDQADLWLQQNDPQLADKSAEYLLNKRIRDNHWLGSQFLDETTEFHQNESQNHEAFLRCVENQHWLNQEVKILFLGIAQDQCLAKIGQSLGGISKQAVHKRLHKHQDTVKYLLKIWQRGQDTDPLLEGEPIPCFVDKNQQLAFDFGGAQ